MRLENLDVYGIPEFIHVCTLLMIIYFGNYAGILDTFLNEGYSRASFSWLLFPQYVRQLTLLGKVAASRKVLWQTAK